LRKIKSEKAFFELAQKNDFTDKDLANAKSR
jgi:hypothetical protein